MKVQDEECPAAPLLPGPVAGPGGRHSWRGVMLPLPSQKGWETGASALRLVLSYTHLHQVDPIPIR